MSFLVTEGKVTEGKNDICFNSSRTTSITSWKL